MEGCNIGTNIILIPFKARVIDTDNTDMIYVLHFDWYPDWIPIRITLIGLVWPSWIYLNCVNACYSFYQGLTLIMGFSFIKSVLRATEWVDHSGIVPNTPEVG